MNPLEAAAQKIVLSLLEEVEEHHLEIGRLVTLGRASDAKIEEINQKILKIVSCIHPALDVIEKFIPDSMTYLNNTVKFCNEIYHKVIEPAIKK